ncbi:MAG: DUF4145 domain-containing protein [Anaerolineae bacterium]|nr:DUF4145 domain-containing protein [Anaerolineae bacterium]
MKCMHCRVEFHSEAQYVYVGTDADKVWLVETNKCPACGRFNLLLINAEGESVEHMPINEKSRLLVYPQTTLLPSCPPQVPLDIAEDYCQARLIIEVSPRASAALSRAALQKVLRDRAGVIPGDLAEEMLDVLDSRQLPPHLSELLKAALTLGNFYAQPLKSQMPEAIHPVAPAEAELNLQVLEALLDFYYIQPAISAGRWASLRSKLEMIGRPLLGS